MGVCCPKSKCSGYREAIEFLTKYGIEPSIGQYPDGHHYLEFEMPEDAERRRVFREAMTRLCCNVCWRCGLAGELVEVFTQPGKPGQFGSASHYGRPIEMVCLDCLDKLRPGWEDDLPDDDDEPLPALASEDGDAA
jgi:hypothetical protein